MKTIIPSSIDPTGILTINPNDEFAISKNGVALTAAYSDPGRNGSTATVYLSLTDMEALEQQLRVAAAQIRSRMARVRSN